MVPWVGPQLSSASLDAGQACEYGSRPVSNPDGRALQPLVPVTVLIILAFIGLLLCDLHVSFWLIERESLWRQWSSPSYDSIRPASCGSDL